MILDYTGEDGDAFHAMNLGADGVISVASHVNGDEMHEMLTAIETAILKSSSYPTSIHSESQCIVLLS